MTEIRIYYECLEQAYDYIRPLIDEASQSYKTSIILIKRSRNLNQLHKGAISAILSLTTPDILITGVKNDKEYPLILMEFTEAVTTEDHELQRSYGALAAYLSEMYYIKISGHKQSEKIFGGAEYNPYNTPKILIEKFNYEGFIIANWETEGSNICNLQRSYNLPSCPPEIPILKITIQSVIKSFLQAENNWFVNSLKILKQTKVYKSFRANVDIANGARELLKTWKEREERNRNPNQLRYFVRKNCVGAKINRFSHAMDPDRGILTFISFIYSQNYSIFGVYALVRPRSTTILKKELIDLCSLKSKLKAALQKDIGGIPKWFTKELNIVVKNAKSKEEEINFQPIWEKYKNEITKNKVIMTLAYFLDGMYLNHNGIKLYWDRYKLLKGSKNKRDFLDLLKNFFGFTNYISPIPLKEVENEVDEDEVTYAIAHRVLIPNKFCIVSISYPGAQGGGAILPEPEKGKAQPREYPDIIALPPKKFDRLNVLLNESKGMFNQFEVEKAISKILRYKRDKRLQNALKETLIAAQVIDENNNLREIIIGVAFGIKNNTPTIWRPDEVDFIFRIVDRKRWAIGIFNQLLKDLIPIIIGRTNYPKVYKIKFLDKIDKE